MMSEFGMRKAVRAGFDDAVTQVRAALAAEGFGVLTEIDVKKTLDAKLGVAFRRYQILGACNPPFAHQALQAELEIGLLLPCNVIVYEGDDGKTVVTAIDPSKTVAATGNPKLAELAQSVKAKLSAALAKLE